MGVIAEHLAKRKRKKRQGKMEVVMGEFKAGTLHSGSGAKVTSRRQAIAIGLAEARRRGY